jgi:hypothetical protein
MYAWIMMDSGLARQLPSSGGQMQFGPRTSMDAWREATQINQIL